MEFKKKLIQLVTLIFAVTIFSGCASLTRGTNDGLLVNSDPEQATVKVFRTNGNFSKSERKNNWVGDSKEGKREFLQATTPANFKLARKGEYDIQISKEGYKPIEIEVTNKVTGAGSAGMAGNILFGGVIGAGIDAGTGAMKDLTPNPVRVYLAEVGSDAVSRLHTPEVKVEKEEISESTFDEQAVIEAVQEETTEVIEE